MMNCQSVSIFVPDGIIRPVCKHLKVNNDDETQKLLNNLQNKRNTLLERRSHVGHNNFRIDDSFYSLGVTTFCPKGSPININKREKLFDCKKKEDKFGQQTNFLNPEQAIRKTSDAQEFFNLQSQSCNLMKKICDQNIQKVAKERMSICSQDRRQSATSQRKRLSICEIQQRDMGINNPVTSITGKDFIFRLLAEYKYSNDDIGMWRSGPLQDSINNDRLLATKSPVSPKRCRSESDMPVENKEGCYQKIKDQQPELMMKKLAAKYRNPLTNYTDIDIEKVFEYQGDVKNEKIQLDDKKVSKVDIVFSGDNIKLYKQKNLVKMSSNEGVKTKKRKSSTTYKQMLSINEKIPHKSAKLTHSSESKIENTNTTDGLSHSDTTLSAIKTETPTSQREFSQSVPPPAVIAAPNVKKVTHKKHVHKILRNPCKRSSAKKAKTHRKTTHTDDDSKNILGQPEENEQRVLNINYASLLDLHQQFDVVKSDDQPADIGGSAAGQTNAAARPILPKNSSTQPDKEQPQKYYEAIEILQKVEVLEKYIHSKNWDGKSLKTKNNLIALKKDLETYARTHTNDLIPRKVLTPLEDALATEMENVKAFDPEQSLKTKYLRIPKETVAQLEQDCIDKGLDPATFCNYREISIDDIFADLEHNVELSRSAAQSPLRNTSKGHQTSSVKQNTSPTNDTSANTSYTRRIP